MFNSRYSLSKPLVRAATSIFAVAVFMLVLLLTPTAVYADNTARQNNNWSNPNWQNTQHHNNWNWRHNWSYQAPEYRFETTFPYDQWGRPTTSNVAAQRTQNIRRDRHSSALPPTHGSQTGFFSGEFPTGQVNPFAPRENNNPGASHAVGIEESVFALRPGETGVNVRSDGSHAGGFLASTSAIQSGGGNSGNNAPHGSPADTSGVPPWTNPNPGSGSNTADQGVEGVQNGVTVTHRPIESAETDQTNNQQNSQTNNQQNNNQNRVTTVTPFEDGTIGRITIPALNNRIASIRPGVELSTLDNYVGHFSYTSQWDGNIALASHNRGRGSFFAGIWTLQGGDRIFYETTMGVRAFEVISIEQISERDLGNLNHSHENILTLVTCVYGQPSLRWSVRAREIL